MYSGVKGKEEEERELLSQIIQKINDVFGKDLQEDDKITVNRMREELRNNTDVKKVLQGDNSEDVKMDYFKQKVKDLVIDIYAEKFDLYKMLMNEKVFPQFVAHMYQSMSELNRKNV